MSDLVVVERVGAVALVTLNRPEAMNALSRPLRRALHDIIRALDEDPSVHAIVLTGAGQQAFTAGLDLKELGSAGLDPTGDEADPVLAVERCRKPVIAAVNGVAITGGFELALACDMIVAATTARFADTHVRMGVIPGWGLSLTGNFLDAATAAEWGLAALVVPPEQLRDTALAIAGDMASAPAAMVQSYKALIDDGFALAFGAAMALERERASKDNAGLAPATLEANRLAVQERGRAQ